MNAMDRPAAIAGSFADFKLIRTRSTAQLVIEIPIEAADEALRVLGGVPQSGKENPVAIARLNVQNVQSVQNVQPPAQAPEKPASGTNGDGAGKRRWEELSRAQRAGIRCGETAFGTFLAEEYPQHCLIDKATDELDVVVTLRHMCGVGSRREFDTDKTAGAKFDRLDGEYIAWMHAP